MSELVQNMMSLAQMDLEALEKHEAVNMTKLLEDMTDEFTPQAH